MKQPSRLPRRGFTLVEVMIVVVIVGLLAMLAVPAYQKLRRNTTGKTLVRDAGYIGSAMREIAQTYPQLARPGATFTIIVSRDGSLTNLPVITGSDMVGADIIMRYVHDKVNAGTGSPITYTFGAAAGEKAFSMSHTHCAPSDVAPASTVNLSATLGSPVQFDKDGHAL